MNCDLAVVGSGGSGLVAAVKARDLGVKNVIVLEAAKKPGGCTWFAGFGSGGYTKWREEAGYPDTTDDTFRRLMRQWKWDINHKLIRNYVDSQGPMFDWFHELCDVSDFFSKPAPYVKPADGQQGEMMRMPRTRRTETWFHINKKSRDPSIGPGRGGSYLVTRMLEQCEKMGIQVITEARAREFIKDRKGNVAGLSADAKDGKLQVNFKACVLAAGGFGRNKEKLKKQWPEWYPTDDLKMHLFSCPTDVGDSLDMADNTGALMDYRRINWQMLGPVHHPYSFTIFKIIQYPEVVYVNLNGERFFNEDDLHDIAHYPLTKQPKGVCYTIVDDKMAEMLGKRFVKENPGEEWPFNDNGLKKDIEYEASLDEAGAPGNHTKKADTFEELAKKMDVDPKSFAATMNRYNEYCDNGRDLDFYKQPEYLIPIRKPPFYAFFGQRFSETTHGGIVINENMELLDAGTNKPMAGLFAAGDNASAMDGGMAWASTSGYMAGIAAAQYLGKA
jgi:fumarate reductase flavoprotein subunit